MEGKLIEKDSIKLRKQLSVDLHTEINQLCDAKLHGGLEDHLLRFFSDVAKSFHYTNAQLVKDYLLNYTYPVLLQNGASRINETEKLLFPLLGPDGYRKSMLLGSDKCSDLLSLTYQNQSLDTLKKITDFYLKEFNHSKQLLLSNPFDYSTTKHIQCCNLEIKIGSIKCNEDRPRFIDFQEEEISEFSYRALVNNFNNQKQSLQINNKFLKSIYSDKLIGKIEEIVFQNKVKFSEEGSTLNLIPNVIELCASYYHPSDKHLIDKHIKAKEFIRIGLYLPTPCLDYIIEVSKLENSFSKPREHNIYIFDQPVLELIKSKTPKNKKTESCFSTNLSELILDNIKIQQELRNSIAMPDNEFWIRYLYKLDFWDEPIILKDSFSPELIQNLYQSDKLLKEVLLKEEQELISSIKAGEIKAHAKYFSILPALAKSCDKLSLMIDKFQVYGNSYSQLSYSNKALHLALMLTLDKVDHIRLSSSSEIKYLLKNEKTDLNTKIKAKITAGINKLRNRINPKSEDRFSLNNFTANLLEEDNICNFGAFAKILYFNAQAGRLEKIQDYIKHDEPDSSIYILDNNAPVNYEYDNDQDLEVSRTFLKQIYPKNSPLPLQEEVYESFPEQGYDTKNLPNCLKIEFVYEINDEIFTCSELITVKPELLKKYGLYFKDYSDIAPGNEPGKSFRHKKS